MPSININVDPKAFQLNDNGEYEINISEMDGNGISIGTDGKLVVNAVGDTSSNYPGNGIVGTSGVALETIQCDSSVSRIDLTKTSEEIQRNCSFSLILVRRYR